MTTLSLAEIVNTACKKRSVKDKVAWLQENKSRELCNILKIMYDPNLKLLIPDEDPPYTPSTMPDSHGMLYREARKLVHFVEGYSGNLTQYKREMLFIEMLETVDKDDAKLLLQMIKQKPLKGLTPETINKAFPTLQLPEGKK